MNRNYELGNKQCYDYKHLIMTNAFEKSKQDQLRTENERLHTVNERLHTENDQLHTENDQLFTLIEQLRTENERLRTENERLRTENTVNSYGTQMIKPLKYPTARSDPKIRIPDDVEKRDWKKELERREEQERINNTYFEEIERERAKREKQAVWF